MAESRPGLGASCDRVVSDPFIIQFSYVRLKRQITPSSIDRTARLLSRA